MSFPQHNVGARPSQFRGLGSLAQDNGADYVNLVAQYGDTDVVDIQNALNFVVNAGLPLTGNYLDQTAAAVKRFKQRYGLGDDGHVVEDFTYTALMDAYNELLFSSRNAVGGSTTTQTTPTRTLTTTGDVTTESLKQAIENSTVGYVTVSANSKEYRLAHNQPWDFTLTKLTDGNYRIGERASYIVYAVGVVAAIVVIALTGIGSGR